MRKLLFLFFCKIDSVLDLDRRLADRGIDTWAHILEQANILLWPEYDGESLKDLILG